MGLRQSLLKLTGFEQMSHRPPLTMRFWIYCAVAYSVPIVIQILIPDDPGLYDELVWLITLAPAFLLSLHYGLKGAVAGLLMGTALFLAVQYSLAAHYTPDDWRVTVPIYIAYGTVTISVGWLSQQLHDYYQRLLQNERMAAIGQVAVTLRHELNNALTAITAESHLLAELDPTMGEEQKESARSIYQSAQRIAADLRKLTALESAPVTEYRDGIQMVDLKEAKSRE
jgi:glucose-6-phosphate-specific signal transduction histidine kinase